MWTGSDCYRLVEVQDEAEEQRGAALQLEAHGGQTAHEVQQLQHRVLEAGQGDVPGTDESRAELHHTLKQDMELKNCISC